MRLLVLIRASKHLSHLWSYVDSEYEEMVKSYTRKTRDTVSSGERIDAGDLLMLASVCYQNGQYQGCQQ